MMNKFHLARISHHSVPLLAEKASSVWGCHLHCFCEAVAHCFGTYRVGEKCGLVITILLGVSAFSAPCHGMAPTAQPVHTHTAPDRYNLGCLDVEKAKTLFGEKPEEAAPEVRKEGIERLESSLGHFREAVNLDRNHADARYNLEAVRLWMRHIQDVWRRRDRQAMRDKMNLAEYVELLDREQTALRGTVRSLAAEPRSLKRRQEVFNTETAQRWLAEEIEPLKAKTLASMHKQPNADKAVEMLGGLADCAGKAMLAAADELGQHNTTEAVDMQAEAVEQLDRVAMVVLPYVQLVKKAVKVQQEIVEQSTRRVAGGKAEGDAPAVPPLRCVLPRPHTAESAWRQRFVARYADMIEAKARHGLAAADTAGDDNATEKQQEDAKKKQEALKKVMQKAIELCPKVKTLAVEAAEHLEEQRPDDALPKQQEALKLLKEMLPEDDQDKQHQEKKDEDKKNQGKQDQDRKDSDGKDRDKTQQRQSGRPKDLSRREADAVLRKARMRQQERRKLEEAIMQQIYRPGKVEKDW